MEYVICTSPTPTLLVCVCLSACFATSDTSSVTSTRKHVLCAALAAPLLLIGRLKPDRGARATIHAHT